MYILEPMTLDDIDEVSAVEAQCFPTPWPKTVYRRELRNHKQNYYLILRDDPNSESAQELPVQYGPSAPRRQGRWAFLQLGHRDPEIAPPPIIGFTGMWNVLNEAHVTTIGVIPAYQGRGLGELLFLSLIDEAIQRHATFVTLEVRVSNFGAQQLYRKYGFSVQGKKPRYYTDNNEDAYIMWSESLHNPDYLALIARLRRGLHRKLSFPHPGEQF